MNYKHEVFVFGSNLAGRHGVGSAAHARQHHGAVYGVGEGRTGDAYAIPTKDNNLKVLSLERIKRSVDSFLEYAKDRPTVKFNVVAVGCGLAGYRPQDIAPMFVTATPNVYLPKEFLMPLQKLAPAKTFNFM